MRKVIVIVFVGLVLTGCTSGEPKVAETQTPSSNAKACTDFVNVTKDLAARIVKGSDASNAEEFKMTMTTMGTRFDSVALTGVGDVKTRIEKLFSDLPNPVHMLIVENKTYFTDVESVQRACKAAGSDISPAIWQ